MLSKTCVRFFSPTLLFAARQCSWVKVAAGWGQGGRPSARQQEGWGGRGGGPSRPLRGGVAPGGCGAATAPRLAQRELQARAACWRAQLGVLRVLARASWRIKVTASMDHRPPISRPNLGELWNSDEFRVSLGALASRRFLDGGAGMGVGPPVGHAVVSNRAHQGGVRRHLGAMPQGQAVHQDLDRPRVLRGVGKVHLVEGDVGVHSASGFSANAGDGAFKGQGAGAQEASGGACTAVVTKLIQGAPTPAMRVCQGEGKAHTAPQENAEVFTGEGELWACGAYGKGSAHVGPGLGQQ